MFSKKHPPIGARPGTLVISDDAPDIHIQFVRYSPDTFEQGSVETIQDLPADLRSDEQIWVDVQGFGDGKLLQKIFNKFEVHPLAAEDLVNVPQVPKSETYLEQQLIVVKVASLDDDDSLHISQVGTILGRQFLLTFRPEHSDLLSPIYERLQLPTSRLRHNRVDYLAYVVLDTAVDTYYPVLEELADVVDDLENRTLEDPRPELLFEINGMKNQLSNLRRSIWPQRETLQSLIRDDCELISSEVRVFLRDTADHCIQATDVIEMYRDRSSGLLSTYLSAVAHRSNEIMKFLTVMSSVFVPLTFVAGIYGMNFPNMPEFSMPRAYYVFWALVICIAVVMFGFFLRNGWIRPAFLRTKKISGQRRRAEKPLSRLVKLSRMRRGMLDSQDAVTTPKPETKARSVA